MSVLRRLVLGTLFALSLMSGWGSAFPVHAQVTAGLQAVGQVTQLPAGDPRVIAARIINISLGFIGIIMVALILYAGFLWMTAGGNPEQVDKAKRYIRNAVIGVIIVLSSWAIATFVINRLLGAVGGGAGGVAGGGPAGGGGGLGGGGAGAFQVNSITPTGNVALRNIEVRFLFSRAVDPVSVSSTIQVLRVSDNQPVSGIVTVSGSLITFVPTAFCPVPNQTRHCFDANTDFVARVGGSLRSTGGQTIACGGFAPVCEGKFRSGDLIDTAAPTAQIFSPADGQSVPENQLIQVVTHATDDAGVSYVESFADNVSVGKDSPQATSSPLSFDATVLWDTAGVADGPHVLQSTAHDVDSNTGSSPSITVAVRPQHCFNGNKDGDETGIDCGGTCGACSGGVCAQNSQCSSGVCVAGQCVEQPIITGITPGDGRAGTFVTLTGTNFGLNPGQITFADGQLAQAPAACVGIKTWTPTQVIVTLPAGAKTGAVQLKNSTSNLSDTSNDERGPRLPDFTVDNVARPGLCTASPSHGFAGDGVDLIGAGLGSTADRVFWGDREISSFLSWEDAKISLNVPVVPAAGYAVKARTGGVESNTVVYQVDEKVATGIPTIDAVDPTSGPIGEYVTLSGRNFGGLVGTVKFQNPVTGEEGSADVTFPAACSVNFWHDTNVVVKVPRMIGSLNNTPVVPREYRIYLIRQDRAQSNAIAFTVVNGTPKPGICALQPAAGPEDTEVKVIGERFGIVPGAVTFRGSGVNRVEGLVEVGKWTATQITTNVPRGAQTGAVQVSVNQQTSNGANFTVKNCQQDASICGPAESCCLNGACSINGICPAIFRLSAQYAWRSSTGIIPLNPQVVEECNLNKPPSPSPWNVRAGGDRACLNADVIVRFNTKLDPKTVTASNVIVRKCTALVGDPCSAVTPVTPQQGFPQLFAADSDTDYFVYRPNLQNGVWEASSTYQIILTTGIQSDVQIPMLEQASTCGKGNAYCFRFSTRQVGEACNVGLVTVTPHPFTATIPNQKIGYRASPRAADDVCIQLNGSSMNWSWDTANDGRASITNNKNPNPPGNVLDVQEATAIADTGGDFVKINATVALPASPPSQGTASLSIRFVDPRVEAYGPGCDQACVNASIWARFNVGMLPERVTAANIVLKRCVNENCLAFDPPQGFDLSNSPIKLSQAPGAPPNSPQNYLVVEPTYVVNGQTTSYLEPGRFYQVLLRGGVNGFLSLARKPLIDLNNPEGFVWTFRVKQGVDAVCATARVDVLPAQKIETVVGSRQLFRAQPIGSPDACNASGQPLVSNQTYAWESSDVQVAKLINGSGDGVIDTNPVLPPHCSDRCMSTGADGVLGHVASCGNGIIETTDVRYCVKKGTKNPCTTGDVPGSVCVTKFGDACQLLSPGSKGGEECDLGGNKNGPNSVCGAACLWNPGQSVLQGGSCGNSIVDRGEQCDPGKSCTAGAFLGKDCVVDADCGLNGVCGVGTRLGCSSSCQNLGARAGASTCGNNDVAAGESCDDSNASSGDGCSADCLHEGSVQVVAVCGNTALEPGESCEKNKDGTWPAKCDQATCLNTGTQSCALLPQGAQQLLCCGNGKTEQGEDCDDGNGVSGDGCSAKCLKEGSSIAYPTPSICGDGVVGIGEQCEAPPGGDKLVDAEQLLQITGTRDPDQNGLMSSDIKATYDAKDGKALYGLQCGFKEEKSCPFGTGLTDSGCCALRPAIANSYPPNGATEVCRNVLISGTFNLPMQPTSLASNFLVAKEGVQGSCPTGTQPLDKVPYLAGGWRGWLASLWQQVRLFIQGSPAQAVVTPWCVGTVSGKVQIASDGNGTKVSFALDQPLEPNTRYRVVFRGDPNIADAIKQGIRSVRGVVAEADAVAADSGSLSWSFKTGTKICLVNQVSVRDTNPDHPLLFLTNNEKHGFEATVASIQDGKVVPLSGIPLVYDWAWQPWVSSQKDVLQVAVKNNSDALSTADVTADNKNGSSLIFARIQITNDKVNVPSSTGQIVEASQNATVLLCERPWPTLATAPFTDQADSPSLKGTIFEKGSHFNFSTLYCQDDGPPGPAGDLPALKINPVPINAADLSRGVLRQYLFTYAEDRLKGDGIGIRIASNPLHLSPSSWYRSQGFTGSPQSLTLDGYEAIKDGTTLYVAAANTNDSTLGDVTSTIYLISHNPDSKAETVNIYDQLVKNWTFNVNFQAESQNVCQKANNDYVLNKDGQTIVCTADWECAASGANLHCASFKAKLQRDTKRIADFQSMTQILEIARQKDKAYPLLSSGSYLQTISTSRWPSWQTTLGSTLGGQAIPEDPVNRFLTCGRCRDGKNACTADSDCASPTDACLAQDGYDPATCWNPDTRRYLFPILDKDSSLPSRIYQYRAVDAGARYELATELEGPVFSRYRPPLLTEVKRCSNTSALCSIDKDCDVIGQNNQIVSSGTCNPTGGRWIYQGLYTGNPSGIDDVCGNGVRGQNELCEVGETATQPCTTKDGKDGSRVQVCSDCSKFVDGQSTLCVANSTCGNGRVDKKKCYVKQGAPGYKYGQVCSVDADCSDPRDAQNTVMACESVAGHGGTEEACDDGILNGTYGHCRIDCQGIGAYCGDSLLSLGEVCDNGNTNGDYCGQGCNLNTSCSLDCRSVAPYCGDGSVDSPPEVCDGNTEQASGAICKGGNNAEQPCTSNNDCPGGSCGGVAGQDTNYNSCAGVTASKCAGTGSICTVSLTVCNKDADCGQGGGVCKPRTQLSCVGDADCGKDGAGRCIQYPTRHTRTCGLPGTNEQCLWPKDNAGASWSVCQQQNFCGDGRTDPGEECDDGNPNDNDACTNQCKKNVCGDGTLQVGGEECDYGIKNGTTCTKADYGSTCVSCSNSCKFVASSGGYCGDNIRNGPEQCDGKDIPAADEKGTPLTCKSLGYDYSAKVVCDQYPFYCVNKVGDLLAIYNSCDPNVQQGSCGGNGVFKTCGGADGLACIGSALAHCQQIGGTFEQGQSQATVDTKLYETCKQSPAPTDVISCTNACSLTGCKRCQDEPGSGFVSGSVYDAIYSNQPIPNARVTVYLRGIKVGETFADENGKFTVSTLNTRPECGVYRIIVDSLVDNPCTGNAQKKPACNKQPWPQEFPTVDEGKYGGYWPYESKTFGVATFNQQGIQNAQGKIFLIPRVGPDETLAVFTWNGDISQRPIDMHLVLPQPVAFGYCFDNDANSDCGKANGICSGPPPDLNGVCPALPYWKRIVLPSPPGFLNAGRRDVAADDFSLRQVYQLSWLPYANLHCFSANGTEVQGCVSNDMAVQTLRFKRGNWSLTGNYSLYLVDRYPGAPPPYQYFSDVSSTVRIVTGDRFYTLTPPQTPQACSDPNDPKGQYWLVFQQAAQSGAVTLNNQLLCKGATTPGEDNALKLPQPLTPIF